MVARADLNIVLKATDRASPSIKNLQSTIIRFVGAVSAALAGLSAVAFPIKQAAEFEKALKSVQKTTGFLNEDIDVLGRALSDLSKELVTPASELAEIAAVAGQLGLGKEGTEGVVEFTKTVAIAAAALDLAAEAAATTGARLRNVFQLPLEQVENVFSTINELSNTTTANAESLIDVITRLGATAGLAFQETAALAATALDVGVSREVAGTSLAKVFTKLQSDSEDFATALGVEIGEFIGLGAFDRFQLFIKTLATQSEQLRAENIRTLAGSGRIFVTIDKLVNDAAAGGLLLAQNIQTANSSFEAGTSILTEYEIQTDALIPTLSTLKNNFIALSKEVGDKLIPKLTKLAEELTEFLDSDQARAFAEQVGEAFSNTLQAVEDFVKFIGELDVNWRNVLAVVKAFIALQLVKVFVALVLQTTLWVAQLVLAGGLLKGVTKLFGFFTIASTASGVAATGALGKLTGFAKKLGKLLIRIAGPVGLLVTIGAVVFGVLEASGIKVSKLFEQVLDFFGAVTDAEAKLQASESKRIAGIKKEAEDAAADIRSVQKQITEKAFGDATPAPIELDRDAGGLEAFNDDVEKTIKGIAAVEKGVQSTETALRQMADRQAEITAKLQDDQVERILNTVEIERQELVLGEMGVLQARLNGASKGAVALLKEQNAIIEARRKNLTREFDENLKGTLKLNTINQQFAQTLEDLGFKINATFDAQQIGILKLVATTEKAERDLKKINKQVAEDAAALAELRNAGVTDSDSARQLQKAEQDFKDLREKQEEFLKIFKGFDKQLQDQVLLADDKTKQLVSQAAINIKDLSEDNLGAFNDGMKEIAKTATDASASLKNLPKLTNQFGLALARLEIEKKALKGITEAAREMADTAKGAFDNTSRTIRAFRGDVLESIRDLDVLLTERRFDLRIDNRQGELERQIEDIEKRRGEIIAFHDDRINNARRNTEKSYLEGRKTDALEALDRELKLVESTRAFLEEKALRDRIKRLQDRAQEFIDAAKKAATAGNVDEALGLSEAARNTTKQISGIIEELLLLEDIDPFGNSSFRVTTKQIQQLLDELRDTEAQVSGAIPGINTELKDVTEKVAAGLEKRQSEVLTQLDSLRKNMVEVNKQFPDFIKSVEAIAALRTRTTFGDAARSGANAAAQENQIRSGAVGLAAVAAADEIRKKELDSANSQRASADKLEAASTNLVKATAGFLTEQQKIAARLAARGGLAKGGTVSGAGSSTSDSIPAMLSHGEFVVNAATRKFFGSGFFYQLQALAKKGGRAKLPGFATGGLVGNMSNFEPVVQAAGMGGAPVHIHLPGGDTMRLREGDDTVSTVKNMMNREARKRGRRIR